MTGPGTPTVVVSAVRTPFGKLGGALKDLSAVDLGALVIAEAVRRAGLAERARRGGLPVDAVVMGLVIQAGAGQNPARQAAIRAGLPVEVPADVVNKVCASGLRAVNVADLMIRCGEAGAVVAGGMESMSNAPYLLPGARWGLRLGDGRVVDANVHDGLWCAFGGCHMGTYGSRVAAEFGITREEQDAWAYRSHVRAVAAAREGRFAEEIMPVEIPGRDGPALVTADEAPRPDTSLEKLAALKPVFESDGTITAGNAPGVNDGAGALVLMSSERARALGLEPLAEIVSQGQASREPPYLHTVPYLSAEQALCKAGLTRDDVALWEINEAFAAVTLTSIKLGGYDPEKVNVDGGAVALGHPIGASGARILMHLIYALRRRGGGYGVAAICSGGGQGEATVVRVG